jgi:hypothetical protein
MSGWTNLTIHASDEETNERIDQELREEYTGRRPYSATGFADRTVKVERGANHEYAAKGFAKKFPEAKWIIVIAANDTSDSGNGTLFRVTLSQDGSPDQRFNQHPVKEIDHKQGYERARGSDVVGHFRDEHGVKGYCELEA